MKINYVPSLVAICISGLFAYGFYAFNSSDSKSIISIGSFVYLLLTLTITIGINFESERTTINIRSLAGVFTFIGIVLNSLFSFLFFSQPAYIISCGISFLIFLLIAYSISKTNQ